MTEFPYPVWQETLQEALRESNLVRLSAKVQAAEAAIFLRLQELGVLPDHQQELEALQKACEELLKSKRSGSNGPAISRDQATRSNCSA
jgi:hypothetical protein